MVCLVRDKGQCYEKVDRNQQYVNKTTYMSRLEFISREKVSDIVVIESLAVF